MKGIKIEGYENYMIFPSGNVWSAGGKSHRSNWLISRTNSAGYQRVQLYSKEVGNKWFLLHRLVAKYFVANPDDLSEVNHINGDKYDNRASNLEWSTRSANMKHALTNKLAVRAKGSKHYNSKLNERDVKRIKEYLSLNKKVRSIAQIYDVKPETISSIKHEKTWKHVVI